MGKWPLDLSEIPIFMTCVGWADDGHMIPLYEQEYNTSNMISYRHGHSNINLDGIFSLEELQEIIVLMGATKKDISTEKAGE